MKKFTVMLLALFLITGLCSCGGKDNENAEPSASPSVTEKAPETEKKQTEQEKEIYDDGIVLPEDGKIEFGKDNKEQKSETQKPEQPKEQPKAKQPQEQPKQEKEPENQTETKPSSADEQGYGNVTWN